MIFELTNQDKAYIEKINNALESETERFPMFIGEKDKTYFIEFKATDIAKANAFATTFLDPRSEIQQMIQDTCGIDVQRLSIVDPISRNTDQLKQLLYDTIKQLENIS